MGKPKVGKVESQSGTHELGAMKVFARVSHRERADCWLLRSARRRGWRRGGEARASRAMRLAESCGSHLWVAVTMEHGELWGDGGAAPSLSAL